MSRDYNKPWIGHPEQMRKELPEWVEEQYEPFDIPGTGLFFLSKEAAHHTGGAHAVGV